MLAHVLIKFKSYLGDFPGGLVVKNQSVNAGDMVLIPGLGRFHMLWSNLSLRATTTEPIHP